MAQQAAVPQAAIPQAAVHCMQAVLAAAESTQRSHWVALQVAKRRARVVAGTAERMLTLQAARKIGKTLPLQ